jgi:branched-chain amino acid transport system ATP-binding protein
MSETAVLSVDRVNKRFGGIHALKDVSFEVQAGEVLGLMGPNGAGKTTLLNVIAGTYSPNSGRVGFCGRDITGLPAHKLCRLGIARTYQIPQPFTSLSARQNILVATKYGGKKAAGMEHDKILLDEMAAGSSDRELPHILGIIQEIRKMGKTVVLVEHVMKVMVEAVDRIVVIDKGAKIAEGTPGEVMEDKKVLEAYFG